MQLTNVFENGVFNFDYGRSTCFLLTHDSPRSSAQPALFLAGYCENIYDGRGVTAGFAGFTTANGMLIATGSKVELLLVKQRPVP